LHFELERAIFSPDQSAIIVAVADVRDVLTGVLAAAEKTSY